MFSGLVRQIATIKDFKNNTISIKTDIKAEIGDSIAVNGACLSVVKILENEVVMNLSTQTQELIALENYQPNKQVHIESALKLSDGLHGHIVQGHIDGIGVIKDIIHLDSQSEFIIESSKEIINLAIPKGSICIDGISLTIAEVFNDTFKLVIIPHTLQTTLFREYKIGRRVNIESDIIARSVAYMLKNMKSQNLTWQQIDSMQLGY